MTTITSVLTADHRHGDALFDEAMRAAGVADWAAAQPALDGFVAALKRHMQVEEEELFPAFEAATGMTGGPTAVMRTEHRAMLASLDELVRLVRDAQADRIASVARSFQAQMASHSTKEENILYPMCDRALASDPDTVQRIVTEFEP